jgi:hypothetical protein
MKNELKVMCEASLSLRDLVRLVMDSMGSEGLAKLAVLSLKEMDCADTFAETIEKIRKLPN